ncbi:hypothetical protein M8J76_010425 [Diaphorina citri]|nr:hypothetical protein M8J75_004352 [Diaphorina citri]KAI5723750.1 hypothetical protein M8J76_010425 [Diaphorina citri]
MAATQAEPPVPEASGPVDPGASADMEHGGPPPPQSLQNGEKNNKPPSGPPTPGGPPPGPDMNVGPKGKMQNNVGGGLVDPMSGHSPYRPDQPPPNSAPLNNNSDAPPPPHHPNSDDPGDKMYPPHPQEGPPMHPGYPGAYRGNYHHGGPPGEMEHMSQMRHGGGYKPMPPRGAMSPMTGGYPQQRFISGQSISQPTGPTPTLNQLLQSSNPGGHRFQNRYGPGEPYGQNWPPPRGPMPPQPYPNQQGPGPNAGPGPNMGPSPNMAPSPNMGPGVYRTQQPPTRPGSGQPPYNTNTGEPPTPGSPSQYPQRYHTPPSRQPYPYPTQPGQTYDPAQQQRQWGNQASHPPQSQSPQQAPSPQSPRPSQSSTPNPHAPDPADISGQNSNDRPTPSPTGSTGSRSVSPAVVGSYGGVRPPYGGYNTQGGPGSQYQQYHMQQQQQHPGFPGQQGGGYNFNVNSMPQAAGYGSSPPTPHHAMGPPMLPPGASPGLPNSHPEPMHPPATNSHVVQMHSDSSSDSTVMERHDNGYGSSTSSSLGMNPATSIVTTGPDGAPMDEASQQSTLSNASVTSGGEEPPVCTPKRRDMGPSPRDMGPSPQGMGPGPRDMGPGPPNMGPMGWGNRHPPGGSNTQGGMGPMEEFTPTPPPVQAAPTPSWPRAHTSHKHDSLSKLFDMDDTVERRHFLEKLLSFMEERGSPITTCPTISKNLLDLFRLYLFVKERGGFLEVCRVNKNKIWKDIAGLLNIGASSSAAYTLRKHYIKNILPFECHFDRGGIDPQPIINQVEASTKKKGAKAAAPTVPSPGSSNSQDSFPSSAGGSMDGYGSYGYPPDFNNQRPPSQPPQGYQGQNYPQYPDQYNQQYPPPPNRAVYPYPGPEAERGYSQGGGPGTQGAPSGQPSSQDYRPGPYTQPGYSPRGAYPGPGPAQPPPSPAPPTPGSTPPPGTTPPGATGTTQDYFRQDTPRRHPDFTKDATQPPSPQSTQPGSYPQTRPMYPGWSPNQNSNYRGPGPSPYPPPQQQWNQCPPRPPGGPAPPSSPQWGDQSRGYPSPSTPTQPPGWGQNSGGTMRQMMRPPSDPSKPFPPLPPTTGMKPQGPPLPGPSGPSGIKREIQFPPDSVEAVTPVVYKRRKLGRQDVAPVEAWRLMMALKSGLLAETCWAIDVLNILLFDDTGIAYFGLSHLPGLLDIILEHFKKSLSDMLESDTGAKRKWYEPPPADKTEPDLGIPTKSVPVDKNAMVVTKSKRNFESRKKPVVMADNEDLFVTDGPRAWESFPYETDELESDTCYIIPTFRGEYGSVPFVRIMEPCAGYKPRDETAPSKPNTIVNSDVHVVKSEDKASGMTTTKPEETSVKIENNKEGESTVKKENTEGEETVKTDNTKEGEATVKLENGGEEPSATDKAEKETTEKPEVKFVPKIIDPAGNAKRRRLSEYEDESYCRDEASLYPVSDSQDNIARRCIALSNILRNLTFVPGNELEFSKNSTFLRLLGRLILAYHEHGLRATKTRNYDKDDDDWTDCCSSLSPQAESEWWWDYMENIRENVLVSLANISGHIDLDQYPEDISRPILDGLLHWAVCPAAQGQDPFPSSSCNLSPQRLALEALCKLCVTDNNVDLVIATPPYARLERLTYVLTRFLCKNEDQVLREFGVNLLHYLAAADSAMSRTIALQSVANQHGIGALRDNPDSMGTSLDMLRRTARTLLHLSRHPDNKPLFLQQEQRLLALVMSQILDQQVAAIISRVLYQTRPDLYQNR